MSNNIIYLKDMFIQLAEDEIICQTIKPLTENPLKPGDVIHLLKKSSRKAIRIKKTTVKEIRKIEIRLSGIRIDGENLSIAEREKFVTELGFLGMERYFNFLDYYHDLYKFPFEGIVIRW